MTLIATMTCMTAPSHGFLANDNLPSPETIKALCEEAGYEYRGIPLRNEPSGPIVAWVKYGTNVAMAEALTQDWVAQFLNANSTTGVRVPRIFMAFSDSDDPSLGHIVMEYIDAPDCDERDDKLVARAVQALVSIPGPSAAPGPVGGGPIIHNFFVEWTSPITYDTVEELQQHINGILKYKGDTRRVDLVDDARDGLRLCPCDIIPGNFKKCDDGTLIALDFRATCFLPPVFFAIAMEMADGNVFAWKVSKRLSYPRESHVTVMKAASYFLVPHGTNKIGIPRDLRQRRDYTSASYNTDSLPFL